MKEIIAQHWNSFMLWAIIWFGAIVHATGQLKIARDNGDDKFTFIDWLILIPLAGFAGMIFAIGASIFTQNSTMINFAAGLGSFLSIRGLNIVSALLLDEVRNRLKK